MMRRPLVLCVPVDRRHMLAECLERDTCLSDMVRNVCRCPIVVPTSIRHGILRETSLRLIGSSDQDHTTSTRMIPRPVGRIHGHTSDTNHCPNPSICPADNVLCNRLLSGHLGQLSLRCDRRCLGIWSTAIDPFPIGRCLVGMQRTSYWIDRNGCRRHMELVEEKEEK